MLNVSSEAIDYMKDLLAQEENAGTAVRIAVMGQSGLGLIVDNPKETDTVYDKEGLQIVVDKNLMEFSKSISITFKTGDNSDCGQSGYIIKAEQSI